MSCTGCDQRLTRISLCRACSGCSKQWGTAAQTRKATCTINGAKITDAARTPEAACPRDRWPDADGVVRWMGLRWHGVPLPVRLLLAAKLYPGCGCSVRVKELFERVRQFLRHRAVLRGPPR